MLSSYDSRAIVLIAIATAIGVKVVLGGGLRCGILPGFTNIEHIIAIGIACVKSTGLQYRSGHAAIGERIGHNDIHQSRFAIIQDIDGIICDVADIVQHRRRICASNVGHVNKGFVDRDAWRQRMVADSGHRDNRTRCCIGADVDRPIASKLVGLACGRDIAGRHYFTNLDRVVAARDRNTAE